MILRLWKNNRRELTESESLTLEEIKEQSENDPEEALAYAAITINTARREQERLWEIIRKERHVIQRLQFPRIYSPNCPIGEEEIAREIYAVASHVADLMEREGMQSDYEVTYNSMCEIARMSRLLEPVEQL